MSISIEIILVYIILTPFIIVNILFAFGLLFQKRTAVFLQKSLKMEEKFKDSKIKILKYVNFIIWVSVGIINVFNLDNPISLGAVLVFLAFRSGTTLSKRFIFGIHDIKIMKSHYSEKKISKIIARVVATGIVIELLFILSWGILYKYLSISIKSNFGIEVNVLVIFLWGIGFIFGFIISLIQSSISKQFLLKNEIGIILLLSGEVVKDKIKQKTLIPKFFRK
ncbi:MAG: hypothetical protein JSV62_01295 [Promethearchaeota archaeon]|nr:MAG: hypothetical protein JSV62_01295 [Candidatus Lokiarchaeota archaeon]